MKVYLAGGFRSGWQEKLKKEVPSLKYYDPFIKEKGTLMSAEEYTVWDLHHVRACDILFAYMEKDNPSGAGLVLEVGFALGLGKTVIFVDEKLDKYHAIVRESCDILFGNLDDGIHFLKTFSSR